jgi:protein involved in polysaccharide export with SLBB domain
MDPLPDNRAVAPATLVAACLSLSLAIAPGAPAQQPAVPDADRLLATRAQLEQAVARCTPQCGLGAAQVRARLEDGDFTAGDRILLVVEGEPQLSDTVTVSPERTITLPIVGIVSLRGVLRSEVERHLTTELAQFLKNPVVHARVMIRIGVLGEVYNPGFYAVPVDAQVSDALMRAGGPRPDAKLAKLTLMRFGTAVYDGAMLQHAINAGRTLDDLGLKPGDQFLVPQKRTFSTFDAIRLAGVLVSIPAAIYYMTR